MQNHDYFMQTNQMLLEGRRFKEAIELCVYAISSAVWQKPIERQCRALCLWTMAETYFYQVGDAAKAREAYMNFLDYVDSDISMITDAPPLREVMEDMYTRTCINLGQLAISYDEYFSFIKKSEPVRRLTQKHREQMEAVEENRNHGISWSDNVYQLAELELSSVESGDIARLPNAIAMFSLFLSYPEIDPSIDMLRVAIINYSSFVCKYVGESILNCAAKRHPANPDNYRFIFDTAIALVSEYLDDMETHDTAKEAKEQLLSAMSGSTDKLNFYNNGYDSVAPPDAQGFIPPVVLRKQSAQKLSSPGPSAQSKPGCTSAAVLPILALLSLIAVIAFMLS